MRRSRSAAPKAADEGGDDSSPMVVGTGVTMDYSAVDNPSLNVRESSFCDSFACQNLIRQPVSYLADIYAQEGVVH